MADWYASDVVYEGMATASITRNSYANQRFPLPETATKM